MENNAKEPSVGIIFFYNGDLFFDITAADEAEDYSYLKTHAKGHPVYWEELQQIGKVPREVEYDEVARGRITYDTRKGIYYLFLDRCISQRRTAVRSIIGAFGLTGMNTQVLGDSHYKCPRCETEPFDK